MPRKPRFFLQGVPCHVVQRGNNREPIFFEADDYHAYLEWLEEALVRYDCELHALCAHDESCTPPHYPKFQTGHQPYYAIHRSPLCPLHQPPL